MVTGFMSEASPDHFDFESSLPMQPKYHTLGLGYRDQRLLVLSGKVIVTIICMCWRGIETIIYIYPKDTFDLF